MSARGQRFTPRFRQPVYYRDFADSFATNPTSGALAVVTNVDSIKQSIYNLVMTTPGSRPGRNSVGSKVQATLFDLSGNPTMLDALKASILEVIQNYEPRATNVTVNVDGSMVATNAVTVTISFIPINLPQVETLSFPLNRER